MWIEGPVVLTNFAVYDDTLLSVLFITNLRLLLQRVLQIWIRVKLELGAPIENKTILTGVFDRYSLSNLFIAIGIIALSLHITTT